MENVTSEILKNLNSEQRVPASTIDGAVLVTAGAGSGKTRLLTHRIAYMVEECGISPYNILAITFTNKAANEMKERLGKMIFGAENMWISTFHSMCSKILRYNIEKLGYSKSFSIYGDTEKNRIIKRLMPEGETLNVETFSWHISNAKNNLLSPEEYSKYIRNPKKCESITKIYAAYEEELFKSSALDFDDLLVKTYELFKKFPEILDYYQTKFKYIFVDEFQDTNNAQYILVKMLAGKYKNILAVGDEDQCIYSWRGAQVENVKRFIDDFEDCKVFKLEQNYRSTKKIIDIANRLIKNNRNRIEKNLWTANEDGSDIELMQPQNDYEEAELIAQKIETLVQQGAKYNDFAILMRTNSLSRILEEKLLLYNIPYKLYGGFKFFERKEIKDTTSYLYLIANPKDTEAATRMLQFPRKGIGEVSIAGLLALSEENSVSIMDIISEPEKYPIQSALKSKLLQVKDLFARLKEYHDTMPLDEFVEKLVQTVGIKEAIGNKTEDDINKCMNVDDLLKSVREFTAINQGATIDEYLQSITLMRDIDTLEDDENYVTMLTVHSAKGLEFNSVFVVGLVDGIFPLSRSIYSGDPNELEEERRLMYVAITRARKRLYLSRPKNKFSYESKRPEKTTISRFLTEIFGKVNEMDISSAAIRTNLSSTGFDEVLDKKGRSESLDLYMSSHANVVGISSSGGSSGASRDNEAIPTSEYSKFKKGKRVYHTHFGEGEITVGVTDFATAFVTVKFDSVGIKTLSLKYAKLKLID